MPAHGVQVDPSDIRAWEVGADLSAARGKCVELSATEGRVTVCNATTDVVLGVVWKNASGTATSGLTVEVVPLGTGATVKCLAGGTIAIGDLVGTHSDGTLVAKTADADRLVGTAIEAAASGEFFSCQLGNFAQRAS